MLQTESPLAVPSDPQANAADLLRQRVADTPDRAIFARPDGEGWRDVTAREFEQEVIALAKGIVAAGIQPGERIGFMCRTSYEWALVDFAAWYAGTVLVPIYETSAPEQIRWNLADSGAIAFLAQTEDQFGRFTEVQDQLPAVAQHWVIERGGLDELVAAGAGIPDEEIERRRQLAVGDDMATLIYTSGSTGKPKGCVLTHSNFVELSRNAATVMPELVSTPGASTLLFVTMAHVFARYISVLSVHAGVRVGHQWDTTKLLPALGSFKPTFLLAVPRVFEKVFNSAEQKTVAEGKGKIFRKAAEVAVAHSKALDAGKVPLGLKLQFALFDKLVYGKLRALLGGNAQWAISGSAPLGDFLGHFYRSLGVTILEGYGLTETTAPATVNLPTKYKIGTVGPALPGVSLKIADNGEVLVKGIDVFKEYWNNPEATAEAFTEDGWFKTGDLGTLDDDGYLTIVGRVKEILVTAGGKNVAPAALEDPIRAHPLVGQVVVVGDKRPFVAALITLDSEMLPMWLGNNGLDAKMTVAEAAVHPSVRTVVGEAIAQANTLVSRAESVREFTILDTEFTEATGHLTPKLSIKRHVIVKDFAVEIDALYERAAASRQSTSA